MPAPPSPRSSTSGVGDDRAAGRRLRAEFADHVGAARGVAVSSCTAGLELALRGLCLARGSRVLMSTNTFCGAAGAITHAGLVPVLADVDPWTAVPTEEHIRAAVRDVGGVSAMVVMHLGGNPVDVEAAAAAAGIGLDHVIEDAAHALGTWVGTRPVGSISRATCFSFYATKNLAIGEGGGDDPRRGLAEVMARSRDLHGMCRDACAATARGGCAYDVGAPASRRTSRTCRRRSAVRSCAGSAPSRRAVARWRSATRAAPRHFPGSSLPQRPVEGRPRLAPVRDPGAPGFTVDRARSSTGSAPSTSGRRCTSSRCTG